METNKPKSRAEQYKEKLKERELYTNNVLDRFTENGAGAPLRNNDGSIVTKRRTMLNDDYEDYFLNQRNATPNPMNYNMNQQQINLNEQNNINNNLNNIDYNNNNNYMNNNFYQTLPNRNIMDLNNIYNINNNNNIMNNDNQITNFNRRPQSINFSNTLNNNNRLYNINNNNGIDQMNNMNNDPFSANYQGTGILPRDRTSDEERRSQNQSLRNAWLKEIEDKKMRETQRKQQQRERELKEDEKFRRENEELKEYERTEKLRKMQNEQNANEVNNLLIENKKKNQNQEEMVMNGNTAVPMQPQAPINDYNPQIQEQNFRNLRETYDNNNNGYQQINDYAFDNNPRELEENINEQIAKLRNDVNSQYIEMSNLFGKLKMDVIEANQLKNEAESELMYIKKELAKNKIASLAYDAQLNQVLERHAPYNNLHINIKDVDPLYSLRNARKDLQSTSNMIYATDMVNEQNLNRVKQLSALAQAGQNLVGLKAESEFIPINSPGENNNEFNNNENNYGNVLNNDPKTNIAVSNTGYKNLESETYQIFQQNNENFDKKDPIILDNYMKKGEYSNMYKQLEEIANINSTMGKDNQLKTISKNYDVDYKDFNEKIKKLEVKNIDQLNKLLNDLN